MPHADIARHYLVTGLVQGVYFRQGCRERALALGLRGWVRNLADGRVEAMVSGAPEALAEFEAWLERGPPRARVSEVRKRQVELADWLGFEVLQDGHHAGP